MKFATGLVAFLAATTMMAAAASAQDDFRWGTSAAPVPSAKPAVAKLNSRTPGNSGYTVSQSYSSAQFATGATALRNRTYGIISVSGAVGPVQDAWLYWAVITQGAPKAANQTVQLSTFFPSGTPASQTVTGTVVGSGATPCWLGDRITVYRGQVSTSIFSVGNGNGLFKVTLQKGASGVGTKANGDPFYTLQGGQPNSPLPEMEGASLVVIGTGYSDVWIYDNGLAGQEFVANEGLAYSLTLPYDVTGASQVLFDEIGADGQVFSGDVPSTATASKVTSINSTKIAGIGGLDPIPDWDGLAGPTIPQLWDDTTHDITSAASGSSLSVRISSVNSTDCIVTVANIIAVTQPQ